MTDTYAPDESIVREFYVEAAYALGTDPSEGVREFERLIARIKAEAWDEGYAAGQTDDEFEATNPYREDEGL